MKTRIWSIIASLTLAACSCAASIDDNLYFMGTDGPDVYSDGTSVLDGERYAVVYQKEGTSFQGFNSDGSLVNTNDSFLVATCPFAKNSKCPKFLLQVDAGFSENKGPGRFELHLLDTRDRISDGKMVLSESVDNSPSLVRGSSLVQDGLVGRSYIRSLGECPPIETCRNELTVTNIVVQNVVVTNTIVHDVYRDVARYYEVPVYTTVTNNVFNVIPKNDIPSYTSGKIAMYKGVMSIEGVEYGTAELKVGKPNTYGIANIICKMKIGKKTYSKVAYGLIDDGVMVANFPKYSGKLMFTGLVSGGYLNLNGLCYELDFTFDR